VKKLFTEEQIIGFLRDVDAGMPVQMGTPRALLLRDAEDAADLLLMPRRGS